jgi:hypothetical protein
VTGVLAAGCMCGGISRATQLAQGPRCDRTCCQLRREAYGLTLAVMGRSTLQARLRWPAEVPVSECDPADADFRVDIGGGGTPFSRGPCLLQGPVWKVCPFALTRVLVTLKFPPLGLGQAEGCRAAISVTHQP